MTTPRPLDFIMSPQAETRFWDRVSIPRDLLTECWNWTGPIRSKGYGFVRMDCRNFYAHRLAFEAAKGRIPTGSILRHACDNPACVNPAHLDAGTVRENALDMVRRGRSPGANQTHCSAGHEYTPENTYRRQNGQRRCRTCGTAADLARRPLKNARRRERRAALKTVTPPTE